MTSQGQAGSLSLCVQCAAFFHLISADDIERFCINSLTKSLIIKGIAEAQCSGWWRSPAAASRNVSEVARSLHSNALKALGVSVLSDSNVAAFAPNIYRKVRKGASFGAARRTLHPEASFRLHLGLLPQHRDANLTTLSTGGKVCSPVCFCADMKGWIFYFYIMIMIINDICHNKKT